LPNRQIASPFGTHHDSNFKIACSFHRPIFDGMKREMTVGGLEIGINERSEEISRDFLASDRQLAENGAWWGLI